MKILLNIFKRKQKSDSSTSKEAGDVEPKEEIREPITSFLKALERTPKRFRLERIIGPPPEHFPKVGWDHQLLRETGCFALLDKKTGVIYQAFVQEEGRVDRIYEGFDFDLNGSEGVALYQALSVFRKPAIDRLLSIANAKGRLRQQMWLDWEAYERKRIGKQFSEG